MPTPSRIQICPYCRRRMPADDLPELAAFAGWQAEFDAEAHPDDPMDPVLLNEEARKAFDLLPGDAADLEELMALVLDALIDHGLGETFLDWQGEVSVGAVGDDEREIVLVGCCDVGTAPPAETRQGRMIVEVRLWPDSRGASPWAQDEPDASQS